MLASWSHQIGWIVFLLAFLGMEDFSDEKRSQFVHML